MNNNSCNLESKFMELLFLKEELDRDQMSYIMAGSQKTANISRQQRHYPHCC